VRKRILFISHTAGFSGAEISLYKLLKGLDPERYIPLVVFPNSGPLAEKVHELGQEFVLHRMPWWIAYGKRTRKHFREVFIRLPERIRFLRALIRERKIDLVYTNTITVIDGAIASKREGVPHLWHIREHILGHPDLKPYIPMASLSWLADFLSDRIVVPSDSVRKEYARRNGSGKIEVVYNGVDVDRYKPSENPFRGLEFRKRVGVDPSKKLVALIGYFHEVKGQMEFVEAAGIVASKAPDSAFLLVGEGIGNRGYTTAVKRRVEEMGLSERIRFVPFQENVQAVYDAIDICVSASRVESFSNVLCEAMAAGKPVVATRSGGPEELVEEGITGLLVPVGDPDRLSDAILRVLGNGERAAEMGRRGRERVTEHFRQDQYVANIQRIIQEMTG